MHRDLAARNVLIIKECISKVRSLDDLNALKYSDLFRLQTLVCHETWQKEFTTCLLGVWSLSSGQPPRLFFS